MIIKSRIYRVFGFVFAALGLLIFTWIFVGSYHGDFFLAARQPNLVFVFLLPFIPACVLAWMSSRYEKKALTLLEKAEKAS